MGTSRLDLQSGVMVSHSFWTAHSNPSPPLMALLLESVGYND